MIKANVPNICSELAFVNDFLSDMEARSMEGYTLVTAQVCALVSYIVNIRKDVHILHWVS